MMTANCTLFLQAVAGIKKRRIFIVKKKQTIYIDEKFIRKLGIENKSEIVNDALKKYYTEERENLKNDLQILSDFKQVIKDLNFKIDNLRDSQRIETEKIKTRLNLIFNMATLSAYSTDVIRAENDKELLTEKINKVRSDYKNEKLKDNNKEETL